MFVDRLRLKNRIRFALRRRALPLTARLECESKPIFIVGSGRSGNTLLRRGLVENSGVCIPPETYVIGACVDTFLKKNHLGWTEIVKEITFLFEGHPQYQDTFGYSLSPLRRRLLRFGESERTLANLLREFYLYYSEQFGLSFDRWGDKTPLNTNAVWDIDRVYPNARYLWLLRDPVDATASYLKSGIYKEIEPAVSRWVNSNDILKRFAEYNPDKVLVVPYASLVSDFNPVLQSVADFCSLPSGLGREMTVSGDVESIAHHSNVMKPVVKSSLGKGYRELKEAEVAMIKQRAGFLFDEITSSSTFQVLG